MSSSPLLRPISTIQNGSITGLPTGESLDLDNSIDVTIVQQSHVLVCNFELFSYFTLDPFKCQSALILYNHVLFSSLKYKTWSLKCIFCRWMNRVLNDCMNRLFSPISDNHELVNVDWQNIYMFVYLQYLSIQDLLLQLWMWAIYAKSLFESNTKFRDFTESKPIIYVGFLKNNLNQTP